MAVLHVWTQNPPLKDQQHLSSGCFILFEPNWIKIPRNQTKFRPSDKPAARQARRETSPPRDKPTARQARRETSPPRDKPVARQARRETRPPRDKPAATQARRETSPSRDKSSQPRIHTFILIVLNLVPGPQSLIARPIWLYGC